MVMKRSNLEKIFMFCYVFVLVGLNKCLSHPPEMFSLLTSAEAAQVEALCSEYINSKLCLFVLF